VSRIESEALVVRTVEFGEADLIVTLVTEQVGKLSAIARGARRGSRRLAGSLEPVHTVAVMLEDKGGDLATLKEARVVRARTGLTGRLDALESAGVALRWARHAFPPRTPEPQGWRILLELLDVLDGGDAPPRRELARAGLAMLAALGYALDLEQCVVCGRPCAPTKAACIDPVRGGLVCRSCGGASTVLLPELRQAARALAAGQGADVTEEQAATLLELVDRAMAAHAGFER
jgi:DNA repair protein RecO (recombination protein O)